MPAKTLMEIHQDQRNRQWVEHVFLKWAQTLTGDLINVKFVPDHVLEKEDAVAIYRPASKTALPRIELKASLLYNPSELLRSYFHELGHHVQRAPAYRRKSWVDEERDAENFGRDMERRVRGICKRNKTALDDLLRYPDD